MPLGDLLRLARDRYRLVELGVGVFALAIAVKAAKVQLVDGAEWARLAEKQQTGLERLPAPRGRILDATGIPLVESQRLVALSIAPNQVPRKERTALANTLARLRVPRREQRRSLDTARTWVNLPGKYPLADAGPILGLRGVYPRYEMARLTVATRGVRAVVGAVDGERAISGVELALDSLLQGVTGSRQLIKTGRGDRLASPEAPLVEPVPGHDVTLTLNYTLQDIAERALDRAIVENDADGGDVVVLNPSTGEILALASRSRTGYATKLTAVTDVYEPGSTIKPFVVGRLLAEGQTRLDETLNTYNGSWNYRGLRTLTDSHREPRMTVAEILQYSSNIGIVQLAERLGPRGEFALFRDLGFGNPTGVSVPAESPGQLKPVARWSRLTASSMAFGYELLVTPLQMALAYGAIANDGVLMHPSVIREVRAPDGRVVWRHAPRPVRTVFPAAVAKQLRDALTGTVEMGTAQSAALSRYRIAGKTGTAFIARNGSYAAREYSASFVGLFPAEKPQLVILAKIERPRGPEHVGGLVAAPVLKAVVEGALAAPTSPLDRRVLAQQMRPSAAPDSGADVVAAGADEVVVAPALLPAPRRVRPARADTADGSSTYAVSLASQLAPVTPVATAARAVPDVRGLALRDAVWVVHNAGFKAVVDSVAGDGSSPEAGTLLTPGSLVRIHRAP